MLNIYCEDCITGAPQRFNDNTFDLMICDPPFGIHETTFDKHYARQVDMVLDGYHEAPENYVEFTENWMTQCKRVLKPNGTMYIVTGWSHEHIIRNMLESMDFEMVNHIIWKYNFGVYTSKKFVSSHYPILYVKHKGGKPKFNTYCRFGPSEKHKDNGGSLNYQDLEDVWIINKEYAPKQQKNKNKLPHALIEKMLLYSSDEGDCVGDFFMGNFTTAYVARSLNRSIGGFELNKNAYQHHMGILHHTPVGDRLKTLKQVNVNLPKNKGKPLSPQEKQEMIDYFEANKHLTKKKVIQEMMSKFERGYFGIVNILKQYESKVNV